MRRLARLLLTPMVLAAALMLPATTAAGGGFHTTVLRDVCTGTNDWTNVFKARETVSGLTTANRLTIDSKAQTVQLVANVHWHTVHTWPRVTYNFTADATDHSLQLRREFAGGGIENMGRIVFNMRSWHNGTLLWHELLRSREC